MLKKTSVFLVVIILLVISFWKKDTWIDIIKEGKSISTLISIMMIAITANFPIIPFILAVGIIVAVFGILKGALITLVGVCGGALIIFFLTRYSIQDWARKKIIKYRGIQNYDHYFAENAFKNVFFLGGLFPIIPSPIMSSLCGLSNIRWTVFFFASLLGQIPRVFIMTISTANFPTNKLLSIGVYGTYLAVVMVFGFKKFPHVIRLTRR
ncbi:VTT domain-containing protein [Bacillus zhangzhouensis]|nr:VTT domain-containing protein [Bacillus zhangzhouensis]